MRLQTVVFDKPIHPEILLDSLLPYFPWLRAWKVNVSSGLTHVVGSLLVDIEEILGSEPEIDFLRIVDAHRDDEMFVRELNVFIQLTNNNSAKLEALSYAIEKANKFAQKICFKCGNQLESIYQLDEQRIEFFLSQQEVSKTEIQFMNFCMACVEREIGSIVTNKNRSYNESSEDKNNAIADVVNKSEKDLVSIESGYDNLEKKLMDPDLINGEIKNPEITMYQLDEIDKLENDYLGATKDQANRVKSLVTRIRANTNEKKLVNIPTYWREYCDSLNQKFPNFHEVISFMKSQLALSNVGDKVLRLPPFLVVGAPGIGKTEFMLTVANDFNTKLEVLDISSSQSGAALTGSDNFWGNTKPGMLFNTLVFGELANPLIMLDEIDKERGNEAYSTLSALHQLLEPRQARKFHDLSVPELTIDASHVIWMATANGLETIDAPILDRLTIFNIEEPTKEQMVAIVNNQYQRFIETHPSGVFFEENMQEEVIIELCQYHPRKVRKILEQSFGFAAQEQRNYLMVNDIMDSEINEKKQSKGIGFMSDI